jgi:hypothetical protein
MKAAISLGVTELAVLAGLAVLAALKREGESLVSITYMCSEGRPPLNLVQANKPFGTGRPPNRTGQKPDPRLSGLPTIFPRFQGESYAVAESLVS